MINDTYLGHLGDDGPPLRKSAFGSSHKTRSPCSHMIRGGGEGDQ
jgi:hypothetical protein